MNKNFSWSDLPLPTHGRLSTRRIFEKSNFDIFIAKDCDGSHLCLVSLSKNPLTLIKSLNININAIKIDLTKNDSGFFLNIKLLDEELLGIFDYILFILLTECIFEKSESEFIVRLLSNLKNWQRFMRSTRDILSEEKIRGLIAELQFMHDLMEKNRSFSSLIVESWCGPERLQQDFIFENEVVEVKSIGNMDKKTITISSLDQLQTNVKKLYLAVYVVTKSDVLNTGVNLNQLVENIESMLSSTDKLTLCEKLLEMGYLKNEKYDDLKYQVKKESSYLVSDEFPKLTARTIPNGVVNVKYSIEIDKIERFNNPIVISGLHALNL